MAYSLAEHKNRGDNFIVVADTYKTLSQATVPALMKFIRPFGRLNRNAGEFVTKWGTTIFFRTATEPDSIEGITNVRRVWGDEAGKFSRYFWENLMGRAAFLQAPIDLTTTPYTMNWLGKLCEEARDGKRPDVTYVHCRSVDSPYFPKEEYERQKTLLDPRRFAMKYEGIFGKAEGLVYDIYDQCLIKSFSLPPGTVFYAGIDWGYHPDPFCFVVRAVTPDRVHYRIFEYYKTHSTISDIVETLKGFLSIYRFKMAYCDPSQPGHIAELNKHGIPAMAANNDIRLGIDIHYELMKQRRFFIFEDMNPYGVDEYANYTYREPKELKLDEDVHRSQWDPVDQANHGTDCDRYLSVSLYEGHELKKSPHVPGQRGPMTVEQRIAYLKRGGSSRYAG